MELERKQFMLRIRFIWSNYLGKMIVKKYYYGFMAKRKLKKNIRKYEKKFGSPIFSEMKCEKSEVIWEFLTSNLSLLMETEKEMNEGVIKELERKMKRIKIDKVRSALNKFKGVEEITRETLVESLKKDLSEKLGYFMEFEYFLDGKEINPHDKTTFQALENNQ